MSTTVPDSCPICRAGLKHPRRMHNQYPHDTSLYAAQYTCGSSMGDGWRKPLDYCTNPPKVRASHPSNFPHIWQLDASGEYVRVNPNN